MDKEYNLINEKELRDAYEKRLNKIEKKRIERFERCDAWPLLEKYFESHSFVQRQIESYNWFINQLKQITFPIIDVKPQIEKMSEGAASLVRGQNIIHKIIPGKVIIGLPKISDEDFNKRVFASDEKKTLPLPIEARYRRGTYSTDVHLEIQHVITKDIIVKTPEGNRIETITEIGDHEQILMCSVPVMVGSDICTLKILGIEPQYSKECLFDIGGFFLINGNEKILVAQEEMRQNQPLVFCKPSAGNKNYIVTEVRSYPDASISSPVLILVKYKNYKNNNFKGVGNKGNFSKTIRIKMPFLKKDIPVGIIFKALGFHTDKEIMECIMTDMNDKEMIDALKPTIEETNGMVKNVEGAIEYLLKKVADLGDTQIHANVHQRIINLLNNDLFPHVGMTKATWKLKGLFLGECIYRLMCVALKRREPDDRDHYTNKRVYNAGPLIHSLYCKLIKLTKKEVKSGLQKLVNEGKPISASSLFLKKTTQRLMYAFATGHWTVVKVGHMGKTGVSMGRPVMSTMSIRSYMSRKNTPIGREAKLIAPRMLTAAQIRRACVVETPEGGGCGLVKNSALLNFISLAQRSNHWIVELLYKFGTRKLEECDFEFRKDSFKIFVNGLWIGNNKNGEELTNKLKKLRRSMDIHFETGIVYDPWTRSIRIYTDGGRMLIPMLIIENGKILLTKDRLQKLQGKNGGSMIHSTFDSLIAEGYIEFIDVEEEEYNCLIAMYPELVEKKHTHCDIHPISILGESAASIPYANHNHLPRNTFQAGMGKHAISIPGLAYQHRMDTLSYVLHYPQRPLSLTNIAKILKFDQMSYSQEAIVGIIADLYNQEDSIVIAQSSLDYGFARTSILRTYTDIQKISGSYYETFKKPNPLKCTGIPQGSCEQIQEDGFVCPGITVSGNEFVISKIFPIQANQNIEETNDKFEEKFHSVNNRSKERGTVLKVMLTTNEHNCMLVKVLVVKNHTPQIGDKFSSMHSQKGIVGMLYQREDLPFTYDGITCDIMINPHAIPSRMTIAQLIQTLDSKCEALGRKRMSDATCFESAIDYSNTSIEIVKDCINEKEILIKDLEYKWKKKRDVNVPSQIELDRFRQKLMKEKFEMQTTLQKELKKQQLNDLKNGNIEKEIIWNEIDQRVFIGKEEKIREILEMQDFEKEAKNIQDEFNELKTLQSLEHFLSKSTELTEQLKLQRLETFKSEYQHKKLKTLIKNGSTDENVKKRLEIISKEWKKHRDFLSSLEIQYQVERTHFIQDRLEERLHALGYPSAGHETFISGVSGNIIEAKCFIGPCSYQDLKHMVDGKCHARAKGPYHILTRQPVEGRARDGGFRFGEMEVSCLWAYGSLFSLKEKHLDQSDRIDVWVCEDCGRIGYMDAYHQKPRCIYCESDGIPIAKLKMHLIQMPYAFKLLLQEMESMAIRPRIILELNEPKISTKLQPAKTNSIVISDIKENIIVQ